MTEEIKEQECKCFCRSEGVKKFVIVALGSFVGVFCALSLFAALHKPPMLVPYPAPFGDYSRGMHGCPVQMMHHKQFNKPFKHDKGDFHKQPKGANPFEAPAPEKR